MIAIKGEFIQQFKVEASIQSIYYLSQASKAGLFSLHSDSSVTHASSVLEYPISELGHSPHDKISNDSSNGDAEDIMCEATGSFGGIEETVYYGLSHEVSYLK